MSKLIKQQSFCKHGHPLIAGDSGEIVLGFCIYMYMRRTRSAVGLILHQNSGDYSGAGQNTATLSEIAELFLYCGAFSKGLQDEQSKSAILYK